MEVEVKSPSLKFKNPVWLNPNHPNYNRWKRARDLSFERGNFVKSIVEKYITCENLIVLDLGSGEGGTSIVFSEKNKVVSYDLNFIRLERQKDSSLKFFQINGNASYLPFKKNSFDLIILQDVIEHLTDIKILINQINRILKSEGIIYISTPNKYSLFNIIADPHWGLPILGLLNRKAIKKFFLKSFRKKEVERKDIPQLFTLKDIQKYFGIYFEIYLDTKHSVEKILSGINGIVWSDFHLYLIKLVKIFRMQKLLLLLSNNKKGIINKYLNPTFYLVMKKIK